MFGETGIGQRQIKHYMYLIFSANVSRLFRPLPQNIKIGSVFVVYRLLTCAEKIKYIQGGPLNATHFIS